MDKLISVIIPTYSRKELTDRAIASVITSFPSLVEIIVVDDCSPTPYQFDKEYNSRQVLVRIIRLQINVGAGMARKAGVENANGKFIAFLDSDDFYESDWMDYIIFFLRSNPQLQEQRIIISGITNGEKNVGRMIRNLLAIIPTSFLLITTRLLTIMFNPFYTPSLLMSKELCFFKDNLRHCEDYYSTAIALFHTDMILLPPVTACHLGREPNSIGGQSAARQKMYRGEMEVRHTMLSLACLPLYYKLLVPIGMMYQIARTALKQIYKLISIK